MDFETEEQQIEAIKKWFSEYGLTIILGLVIGLGGVFGFRAYEDHTETQKQMASADFQAIMTTQSLTPNSDTFKTAVADFKSTHGDTIYGNLLDLHLAKLAVDAKDLAAAEASLTTVLNKAEHSTVEHSARLRLTRVMIAQQKYEEALALIADVQEPAYAYNYEMLRGDIWLARGDETRAKAAYDKAKTLATDTPQHPDLEMILTELEGATKTAEVEASAGDQND